MNIHSVIIKCNKYGLIVILDENLPFEELIKDVEDKFKESAKFFKNAEMAMTIRGRSLTQAVKNKLLTTTSYQTFDVYYHVDPTLIGGMVIRVGDRVVDSSIRTKLEDMKKQLLNIQLG